MDAVKDRMRLAVIGSPRSGNTWTRSLLKSLYGLEEFAIHSPDELDWSRLPERSIVQIHWYPMESFLDTLRANDVRVIMPMRHPFDVLMSWLNYMYYVHEEGKCPGDCGSCQLVGALPMDADFRSWVMSEQGRTLLCYGPAWFARPGVFPLRYELLVEQPESTLHLLARRLQVPFTGDLASILQGTSLAEKRVSRSAWQYHFWQGQAGLWRKMLTAERAREIAAWIPEPFDRLGYDCDPDESLDQGAADRNWLQLQLNSVRQHLTLEKAKHRETKRWLSLNAAQKVHIPKPNIASSVTSAVA